MKSGTPSKYTVAIADDICRKLMEGMSLRSICRDKDKPDRNTVFRWLMEHESFAAEYARARDAQADTLADEILDISDDGSNDFMVRMRDGAPESVKNTEVIERSKMRIATRQWIAAKLKPKKYGEKSQLEMGGPNGGPIETRDISARELLASRMAGVAARLRNESVPGESDGESE